MCYWHLFWKGAASNVNWCFLCCLHVKNFNGAHQNLIKHALRSCMDLTHMFTCMQMFMLIIIYQLSWDSLQLKEIFYPIMANFLKFYTCILFICQMRKFNVKSQIQLRGSNLVCAYFQISLWRVGFIYSKLITLVYGHCYFLALTWIILPYS